MSDPQKAAVDSIQRVAAESDLATSPAMPCKSLYHGDCIEITARVNIGRYASYHLAKTKLSASLLIATDGKVYIRMSRGNDYLDAQREYNRFVRAVKASGVDVRRGEVN